MELINPGCPQDISGSGSAAIRMSKLASKEKLQYGPLEERVTGKSLGTESGQCSERVEATSNSSI